MKFKQHNQLYVPAPTPLILPAWDQSENPSIPILHRIQEEFDVNEECLNRWQDRLFRPYNWEKT